jgi:hypothetical protein
VGERSDAEPLRPASSRNAISDRCFAVDVAKDYQCQLSAQIVPVDRLRNGRAKPLERGGHCRSGFGRIDALGLD